MAPGSHQKHRVKFLHEKQIEREANAHADFLTFHKSCPVHV